MEAGLGEKFEFFWGGEGGRGGGLHKGPIFTTTFFSDNSL